MSKLVKEKLAGLGYNYIPKEYLTNNDEYYFRNQQFKSTHSFRKLTVGEVEVLITNHNYSNDWNNIWVTDKFLPEQIQYTKFYGFVRIGDMEEIYMNYRDLRLPSGIYNSTIVSCDIGDTVALHNVRYMAHFIVGNDVILANINEMETNSGAKFGNGILKEGDVEERRIRLELCNENGGRSVLPFDGMQASDVYLWSRNRDDRQLQSSFLKMTESRYSNKHGFYSEIGDRCVIKNTQIIKDVKIGTDAYIKGVNKLKNLTINSASHMPTQIGEGCELVNGIIGYGCRIFYGVKAVRFILSANSQLKYGARLINSFLGDNSTISCCEVLNTLIFPAHEQHHNNSFLCASLVKGQSNMAAGATVGSNHNSRAADGEIVAGRGFWPGLCVSLKHNSRFASYTIIVKGDFLYELDIRLPFALVSNDAASDKLIVVPGYWFMYNMYALMRNVSKFKARDKRGFKNQYIEYDVLAPDTVNEMFAARAEIAAAVGLAYSDEYPAMPAHEVGLLKLADGQKLAREILLSNVESSKRKAVLAKPRECYLIYERMIRYYGIIQLINALQTCSLKELLQRITLFKMQRDTFENVGGQLIPSARLAKLLDAIRSEELDNWDAVHKQYHAWSKSYQDDKFTHAMASLAEISGREAESWDAEFICELLREALEVKRWIFQGIKSSREKDYTNSFRRMVYENDAEMAQVLGDFKDNEFINKEEVALELFANTVAQLIDKLK